MDEPPFLADLLASIISVLGVGDYQHEAEELVSIKRKRLSVFGLRGLTARRKREFVGTQRRAIGFH